MSGNNASEEKAEILALELRSLRATVGQLALYQAIIATMLHGLARKREGSRDDEAFRSFVEKKAQEIAASLQNLSDKLIDDSK
jgi:hypothetical protein